jgi:pyridoxal phosphate enzyme (YggS family)
VPLRFNRQVQVSAQRQSIVHCFSQLLVSKHGLVWHCIGPIQSNKTRLVAEHFDWVHSVDRLKIAQRLSEQRPPEMAPLNVCIQVNIDAGPGKAGVTPDEALALAQAVAVLPRLRLRGLMTIPEPSEDYASTLAVHRQTKGSDFKHWAKKIGSKNRLPIRKGDPTLTLNLLIRK